MKKVVMISLTILLSYKIMQNSYSAKCLLPTFIYFFRQWAFFLGDCNQPTQFFFLYIYMYTYSMHNGQCKCTYGRKRQMFKTKISSASDPVSFEGDYNVVYLKHCLGILKRLGGTCLARALPKIALFGCVNDTQKRP